jgi:acyl-CoA reductase-like NAD-dependent aldehyde dehydrogenase
MIDAVQTIDRARRATEARPPRRMIIGGKLRSGSERGGFGLISPEDGREIVGVPKAGAAGVAAAVSAARRAFGGSSC